jgi:YD repeat-containing protein
MALAYAVGVAVASAACSAPAPVRVLSNTAPGATTPLPSPANYCPQAIDLGPWAHELFPACAWPQLGTHQLGTCGGPECEAPCRLIQSGFTQRSHYDNDLHVIYNDAHQWVGFMRDADRWTTCTYADGKMADCAVHNHAESVVRDPAGRITSITRRGRAPSAVTYDERGDITAIGDHAFRYDAQRRMIADGDFTLTLGADGHVTHAAMPGEQDRVAFTYDAAGRLSKIEQSEEDLTSTLTYDRDGRLINIEVGGLERHDSQQIAYDCTRDVSDDGDN